MTKIDLPLRSVSQINQYTRCPMNYKLARIDKVWNRPAAWLPQGTAFHGVAELVEIWESYGMPLTLEEAHEIYKTLYAEGINEMTEETPNLDWWFWSGPYNGFRDIERRWEIGLEQVDKFFAWKALKGQQIWVTPDGTPAIELSFRIELPFPPDLEPITGQYEADGVTVEFTVGGIIVRGFIDAVVEVDGELRVRDYKTGNTPGDDFQLGVYALAIEMLFGIRPAKGDYFMAGKKGLKPVVTQPYDLSEWTQEAVTQRFHEVEAQIQAGEFPALPTRDKCGFCDVNLSCPIFQG